MTEIYERRGLRRRTLLLAAASALAAPAIVRAQTREKVTFALSYGPIGANCNYLYPASYLKFWEAEGLDVEVITTQGTGQVLQLLTAGRVDMGTANPEPYIAARVQNNLPALSVGLMGVVSTWAIGVLPDSPLTSYAELKGKTVGVTSLATGGIYFLKARLIEAGLNPDKDVTLVPVGFGASANEAVSNRKVDAMLLWRSGFATLENVGAKFRYLPRVPWEDNIYSLINMATKTMIAERPQTVAKVLRGISKCFDFSAGSPEAAAMVFQDAYPSAVSRSLDAKTNFANNVRLVEATNADAGIGSPKFPAPPSRVWHQQADDGWNRIQAYLVQTGLIKEPANPAELYTGRFVAEANDYDKGAVLKQAKAYPVRIQP